MEEPLSRLRWKLSHLWGKSYDDPYWLTLHYRKWRIFAEHHRKDQEEELERLRGLAEYIMSFHNPDAVKAVQRSREMHERNQDKQLGDIFAQQVAGLFGRKLDYDAIEDARKNAGVDKPGYIPADEEDKADSAPAETKADKMTVHRPNVEPNRRVRGSIPRNMIPSDENFPKKPKD